MVFRSILIIIFLNFNSGYSSSIIYDKEGILISDIEFNNYLKIYEANFEYDITKNQAIKNIVLIKKTINYFLNKNPNLISILDKNIKSDFNEEIIQNQMFLDFLRFQNIRNEYTLEYFRNEFNIQDLNNIFSSLDNLKIPLSRNKCLTIEKLYKANEDKEFIFNFLDNLKNNTKDFKTKIDNFTYDVCINDKLFNDIEIIIFKYIENKTENEFKKFIYGMNNWKKN